MKKYLIGCGVATLIGIVLLAGFTYFGARELHSMFAEAHRVEMEIQGEALRRRRTYLEANLSPATRGVIPADFYSYRGFRDWWRMPLVFPYQIGCVDTLERGHLETYDPAHPVKDPNRSTTRVLSGIRRLATDNEMLLFELEDDGTERFGMLNYLTGTRAMFATEAELHAAARDADFQGPGVLSSIGPLRDAYFDYAQTFPPSAAPTEERSTPHE